MNKVYYVVERDIVKKVQNGRFGRRTRPSKTKGKFTEKIAPIFGGYTHMRSTMSKIDRFVFLSQDFYNDYPQSDYPEMEQKLNRPYIQVLTLIDGVQYAIPLRSNINHPHALWTDKENRCGLDFSKAVVITDERYIDKTKKPHIRQNEFDALRGKEYRIQTKMKKYLESYKKAKEDQEKSANRNLCQKSTLQYFESFIYTEPGTDKEE